MQEACLAIKYIERDSRRSMISSLIMKELNQMKSHISGVNDNTFKVKKNTLVAAWEQNWKLECRIENSLF
jgi:hypothetical protein